MITITLFLLNSITRFKMNIPTYDFPHSPILIIGFFGILTALTVLFVANRSYFDSPFNADKK